MATFKIKSFDIRKLELEKKIMKVAKLFFSHVFLNKEYFPILKPYYRETQVTKYIIVSLTNNSRSTIFGNICNSRLGD